MQWQALLCLLLATAAVQSSRASARILQADCAALQTSSLQFKGERIGTAKVSAFGDGCCEACAATKACAMWWAKDGSCEMFNLDKGAVTWSINYQPKQKAGLMSSGPAALAERSSDCDGPDVWLFKGIALDGVARASSTDPYVLEGGAAAGFKNGFAAKTWQECCKGAAAAPGTSLMERHYQYRGRQYWTWSEGKCYVKVRPFQAGATVLTMRRAPGVISGMFGNEP